MSNDASRRWIVFGRREYAEPLREQGMIEANNASEASQSTVDAHGRDWVELTLVPQGAIRWVLKESERIPGEPTGAAQLG